MEEGLVPALCGGVFHSSKQEKGCTIGKYGVGLKAIMLFYDTVLSVSSSTVSESSISSYQVRVHSLCYFSYE